MHEDLAKRMVSRWAIRCVSSPNLYDADNEKGANETVEVTIKGLFSGKNQAPLTYAQELYEDTLISDLDTAAKLYGNTVQTATYEGCDLLCQRGSGPGCLDRKNQSLGYPMELL